ncbi:MULTISPECIES: ParB/RepB/Spo0J family partition protein [unclassified Streptomyces]|uniref:ParB/RepB/Spo0J family partition protein n=1 Tax=unclassified Streptomyces TaxID=2593676 RepID=UPI002E282223|nr:ParB/RepB/Spo0J family partition protein [Streptomyces sp. NBC_01423]WSX95714.1 ParB/RepB/Spo0J family partition protein [Streptomyces sp. NBC_00891]WSY10194.1 ParB/RepB/Spo0J family partition protein [Streptomyces sp. NBC_00890]WSZ11672.1 ParB/RepB/Spo0J family partition protein [Streptomyces sp. NBC_00869]WSZ27922.1 ParB/RepB/Spo0J family partition protein [Streptomyces sp. NBC_00870]
MSKEEQLGASSSFARAGKARSVRRQLTDQAFGTGDPNELPLSEISANPDNPRETLGDVSGMAASLAEIGQVQAITVASVEAYLRDRPERASELEPGASYVVVDGHRRLAGAHAAGLATIKVSVDDARVTTDEALLEAAFVANAQRENLSDLEEAAALKTLVAFYGSQHKAARRLGVTQPYISQRLSLLDLDPELQADLEAGRRKVEHVRGLGKHSPQEQRQLADTRAQKAAEKKRRQLPKAETPTDNAVIGSDLSRTQQPGAHSPADNAVIGSGASSSPPRPEVSEADAPDNAVITQAADESWENRLPWHSPQALNTMARERMTAEDRQTLAKLLSQE